MISFGVWNIAFGFFLNHRLNYGLDWRPHKETFSNKFRVWNYEKYAKGISWNDKWLLVWKHKIRSQKGEI